MFCCVSLHLTILVTYLLVWHFPLARRSHLKVVFIILISLQEILSFSKPNWKHPNKLPNSPWVQSFIMYTQRLHSSNMNYRLVRRSISYSNHIDANNINASEFTVYKGNLDKYNNDLDMDYGPDNGTNHSMNSYPFSTFNLKEKLVSKYDSPKEYSVTKMLNLQEADYINNTFNYYEQFQDQTMMNDNWNKPAPININSVEENYDYASHKPKIYPVKNSVISNANVKKDEGLSDG